MTEGVKKANPPSPRENEISSGGNSKKKPKGERFPTKVVVRKLPPSMNLESFLDNVSPLPDNDYVNFVPADNSLFPHNYSRGYINFSNQEDLLIFTQKFDNYVFVDSKGHEYPALVEFAPFQRIPKVKANKKKDSKCNTIEDDPHYIKFKERLLAEEDENESGKQNVFETTLPDEVPEKVTSTPLLDYLRKRREEKKRIREEKKEERKKRELERRKVKDEQRKAKKVASTTPLSVPGPVPSDISEPAETSATSESLSQEPPSPSPRPLSFSPSLPPLSNSIEEQTNALKKLLGLPVMPQDPPSKNEAADPSKASNLFNKIYIHQKLELELLSNYSKLNQAGGESDFKSADESDLPFKKFLMNDLKMCCFPISSSLCLPLKTDPLSAKTASANCGDYSTSHGYNFKGERFSDHINWSMGDTNFSWHQGINPEPEIQRIQYPTNSCLYRSEKRIHLNPPNPCFFTKPVYRRGKQQKRRHIFQHHVEHPPWFPCIENTSFVHCVQFRNAKNVQATPNYYQSLIARKPVKLSKFRSLNCGQKEACCFGRFSEMSCSFNMFHAMSGDFARKKKYLNSLR